MTSGFLALKTFFKCPILLQHKRITFCFLRPQKKKKKDNKELIWERLTV